MNGTGSPVTNSGDVEIAVKRVANSDKIILHLCASEFASDSREYRSAGYDVRAIDEKMDVRKFIPPPNVYGIIANPPCQKFSMANPKPRLDRDFSQGMELVRACLEIIWKVQETGAPLAFWAIENPRGYLERFLGKPAFQFQNWQFGETNALATKRTNLWGYFNEPQFTVFDRSIDFKHDGSRYKPKPQLFDTKEIVRRNPEFSKMTSDERSVASPYFTRAFFLANQ